MTLCARGGNSFGVSTANPSLCVNDYSTIHLFCTSKAQVLKILFDKNSQVDVDLIDDKKFPAPIFPTLLQLLDKQVHLLTVTQIDAQSAGRLIDALESGIQKDGHLDVGHELDDQVGANAVERCAFDALKVDF